MTNVIHTLHIDEFNDFNQNNNFYVSTLENHLINHHHRIEKPHKHDFHVVVLFTQGKGVHEIDFKEYTVNPGSLFFLFPGQVHAWNLSEDTKGFIFFHSGIFTNELEKNGLDLFSFSSTLRRSAPNLNVLEYLDKLTDFFKKLLIENQYNAFGRKTYLLSLVTLIYIEISRKAQQDITIKKADATIYENYYNQFALLLEADYKVVKSPSKYAKKMNITAKHLNRIMQLVVGKSTSDMILDRIILEAQRMLIYERFSKNEIASALGYEDYVYFSHIFKSRTGYSPSDFQKNIGNRYS